MSERERQSMLRRIACWFRDDDRPIRVALYIGDPMQRLVCVFEGHDLIAWNENPRLPLYARCTWCQYTSDDYRIEKDERGFWQVVGPREQP